MRISISELLPRAAASVPSRTALKRGNHVVTFGELHDAASRLARAFAHAGIVAGDRIALVGEPSIELVISAHAAVAVGAIPVGVFPNLPVAELQQIVDHVGFAAIVFDDTHAAITSQLRFAGHRVSHASIADQIARHPPIDAWHRPAPDDVALIIFTGGTTGVSKGVMHTHQSVSAWMGMRSAVAGESETRSVLLNLAHGSGQSTLWTSVSAGGCLVLLERYPPTPEDLVDVLERERITGLGTVPMTMREILDVPGIEHRDLSALATILVGGSPPSARLLQRAAAVFRSTTVLVGYGQSESGPMITVLPVAFALRGNRLERMGSVGRPSATHMLGQKPFTVRILDDEGREVAAGAIGEIVVRGDQMMVGYWNDPVATREVLRDGWLHTRDLGRFDESGYLYLVDRKRDIIVHADGNIYSSEVEAIVEDHPAIAEAAIVGQRVEDCGERVIAFAALRAGAALSLEELQCFCAERIAAFKLPAGLVIVPALPRTEIGKIDKAQLRRMCMSC